MSPGPFPVFEVGGSVAVVTQLHDLTALQHAANIRSGTTSAAECVDHYLRRIDQFGTSLGAFVTVTAERAREQARAADAVVATGSPLPPLHGVPFAVKDLTSTADVPTSFGSAAFAGFLPSFSDDVVGFLEQAGAISLGKTNAPEFGLACYTENLIAPPARSPHDPNRMAGGSSGGAAAAVAAGLLPFAHGTDGGGSLRIPASMCGLVGLKTSRGLISRGPAGSDVLGMSVHGPLARNSADAAALLTAMVQPTVSEPFFAATGATGWPPGALARAAATDPRPLRIGRTLDTPVPGVEIDPEVRAAYDATADLLRALGHSVIDLRMPEPPGLLDAFLHVWGTFAHGVPVPPEVVGKLTPLTRYLRERGAAVSGPELVQALGTVQTFGRMLVRGMQDCDLVLTPTVARLPPPVGYFTDGNDPSVDFDRQLLFTPWTAQANISGQPAINVPLQWSTGGLPIGMQFAGRSGSDALLLALCGQLERAQPWRLRTPAMW